MAIRAIVFDIGGVLERVSRTGWEAGWEQRLGLQPGELDQRLLSVWRAGSRGDMDEAEVEQNIAAILGLDEAQLQAFMADLWAEYLGELDAELAAYFGSLRPRYRTAIISNSFAGARRREQESYGFEDLCDLIVYSHEVGSAKPDRRIFDLACERIGIRHDEMIFVDDVAVIIDAARALGIHGIQHQNTATTIAAIEARLAADAG